MISVFDMENLQKLLKDFYAITGIRITVFDDRMRELAAYPEKVAPYCALIRESAEGLKACMNCDRQACRTAAEKKKTHIYRCHAGFTEAVTPLYGNNMLIGFLLFGHVFPYDSQEEGWQEIKRRCASLTIDPQKLHETILQATPMQDDYVRSAAHILHAVASYLILERMATLKEDLLEVRLDTYIANHYTESLDAALLRPGRFDRRIPVELPDVNGREAILKVHAKDVKMRDDVDLKKIARSTPGASGAELANIINEAALCAVRNKRDKVTNADLEQAVDIIIAGYQRKNMVISEEEKKNTAYHEIGHALVAASQTHSAPVEKITIIPHTNGSLGYTMQVDEQEKLNYTKEDLFTKIVTFTGGRAAEEVVFNHMTAGASNDIEQATRLARAMVTRFGMTEEFGMMGMETIHNAYLGGDATLTCSEATLEKVDVKVMEIIKEAHQKALAILREHREELDRLASYLLEKETITGVEFMAVLNNEDPVEAVRRAAEEAESRNAEQRVKDEEKARREAEELAAKQAQWTAASAAAGMESGALGKEVKDGATDAEFRPAEEEKKEE